MDYTRRVNHSSN